MLTDRFWIVADDESRFWSSAAGAYVNSLPEGLFLSAEDALSSGCSVADLIAVVPTRIASEGELTDVLAGFGLPGPVVRVPGSVSARQFKLQLLASGLLGQVEAFIAAKGPAVQIAYDNSNSFVRTEPMMASGFAALGFNDEQVDAFFVAAAQI